MAKNHPLRLTRFLAANLIDEEHSGTKKLISELGDVKKLGYFTKSELMRMAAWKSHRTKHWCQLNSRGRVLRVSKAVFGTRDELERVKLLVSLHGVSTPTASAILMLTDPKKYGVIDIRVWQLLYKLGKVATKAKGVSLGPDNWLVYLAMLRKYAKRLRVSARTIERTLFVSHKKMQKGKLYASRVQ